MDCPIVIDNFLDENIYLKVKEMIYFNDHFPFFLRKDVTFDNVNEDIWSWYGSHILYQEDKPNSQHFEFIYNIFIPKLQNTFEFKSLLRIKANFYPHTSKIKEHSPHTDYKFDHFAAIFSLNTCDGFTRINNKEKFNSIDNRLLVFNGGIEHNSSTTTTDSGRINIGFNWT